MVHGHANHLGLFHRFLGWIDGCIAVTNEKIDEIWTLVQVGTIIEKRS